MKRLLLTLLFSITFLLRSLADEGMWLPLLLGQQVYNDMVKRGLKLSKEQLYSLNKPSLKDAIVIFGGGCTGEVVSAEGLIFTDRKSTRLNSSHSQISYAVFCLKKKKLMTGKRV